jgi:hypothetical protein
MYPSTVILYWNNGWIMLSAPMVREAKKDFPAMEVGGVRKLIVTHTQWHHNQDSTRVDFKEWPDFPRMFAEAGITVLIGGGLAFAIRSRRNVSSAAASAQACAQASAPTWGQQQRSAD